jgi:hypothetical protein
MDIIVSDRSQAYDAIAADKGMPRRPLWPVLVIALATSATILWAGVLVWILARMIFLLVSW